MGDGRERMECFFFNDTATTEIYTLSLHDALPIFKTQTTGMDSEAWQLRRAFDSTKLHSLPLPTGRPLGLARQLDALDRKSTRLNSSHANISYAVFCLQKKPPLSPTRHLSLTHLIS